MVARAPQCFPEVAKFQQTILRWNFFKLIEDEEAQFESVPKCFRSVEEYISVFRPLVIEECRANIFRGSEENVKSHRTLCIQVNQINGFEVREYVCCDRIRTCDSSGLC